MKYKVISFDLDNTIVAAGYGVNRNVADRIVNLEKNGYQIIINSGKNAPYLAGFSRGLGLQHPIVIGENGSVIFDPVRFYEKKMGHRVEEVIHLEKEMMTRFSEDVWIQPNQVMFALFPKDRKRIPEFAQYIRSSIQHILDDFIIFEHIDAIDVMPKGIDKGTALKHVLHQYGFYSDQVIGIGDSKNDIDMLKASALMLIRGKQITIDGATHFETIEEILDYVDGMK